jgi:hypothetical protein
VMVFAPPHFQVIVTVIAFMNMKSIGCCDQVHQVRFWELRQLKSPIAMWGIGISIIQRVSLRLVISPISSNIVVGSFVRKFGCFGIVHIIKSTEYYLCHSWYWSVDERQESNFAVVQQKYPAFGNQMKQLQMAANSYSRFQVSDMHRPQDLDWGLSLDVIHIVNYLRCWWPDQHSVFTKMNYNVQCRKSRRADDPWFIHVCAIRFICRTEFLS